MNAKKIVIAGGTTFLGQILTAYFTERGVQMVVLTRGANKHENGVNYVHWNGRNLDTWREQLEGADALINLSGKSVNCRYTKRNKQLIYNSRLESTRVLGLALMKAKNGPKIWINATSATIYRHADRPMTEANGLHGVGFSVDVCEKWERMFFRFDLPKLREVTMRTTIVLGKEHGAFGRCKIWQNLVLVVNTETESKCSAGSMLMIFAVQNNELNGIVNLGAPEEVKNEQLMHELRDAVDAPFGLPSPKWMLEIGAVFMGTETELLLKSPWIEPEKLKELGFHWEFPTLEKALAELCAKDLFAATVSKPIVAH